MFNQFYKEQDQSTGTARGGEFFSLAASTASSQLNNLLSQMINSNKWSFGFDLRRVDEVNMEYQVDLLYQPNDRWIVNGNFGYRDNNNNIEDYNQYITDVDIEYLLTKSGDIRLRAYNKSNDRYSTKTTLNTQGIGVVIKRDFDSWLQLLDWRKEKKKEK